MTILVDMLALARGLDLDDVQGRATLRDRIAEHSRSYSTEDLVAVARELGRTVEAVPGAAGRASLIRILGNACTQKAMQGKAEVVTALPRASSAAEQRSIVASWDQVLQRHREHLLLGSGADQAIFFSRIRRTLQVMPLGTVCALALAHGLSAQVGDERTHLVEMMCEHALGLATSA